MPAARKSQINLSSTSYYHCMSRCVRRAFLCGEDQLTGNNYDHRKGWIVERIKFLSSVFAVDVCAYAVMSNHYHVVLHVDVDEIEQWSDRDVLDRWLQLFPNGQAAELVSGEGVSHGQQDALSELIPLWRERLGDISWFMRCLNEMIARQANKEDQCKGRFWESRFKSQALLDEGAILTCMAYLDLNPVRAGLVQDFHDYPYWYCKWSV